MMMKWPEFFIFLLVIISGLLLIPIGLAEASQANSGQSESIYNRLAKEFDLDKARLDKRESINKLELMFKGYALDAVDFTKQNFKEQLDFSEDSIKDVEKCLDILNKTREQYKPSNEQLLTIAKMYAGYIGQVIKLRWGGEWRDESEYSFENGPALKVKEQHFFLLSKVHRRIIGGSEDNIWHFYLVIKKDLEAK